MRHPAVLMLLFVFTVGAQSTISLAEDWTEFRGPTGQGHSTATNLPLSWSETENIGWKVRLEGIGWSSPIVKDNRIYLTTAVSADGLKSDQSLRVMCLDAKDGSEIWNVEAFVLLRKDIKVHKKNSHASPTPILEGDRLYVHFGSYGTACLDLSGKVIWQKQLEYSPVHGTGGSPALVDDKLVICCDGSDVQYVVGLNTSDGNIAWKTPRDTSPKRGFSFSTPLVINVAGKAQAVCPGSDAVFSYDPQTGKEIWRVRYGDGYSVVPRPLFAHGLVFVCSGFDDKTLYAIAPTGTGDVTETHVKWQNDKAIPRSSSLVLVDDDVFIVDDAGVATCADAKSGKVHWTKRIGGKFSASPLAVPGRIYYQDEDGKTTVIEPSRQFKKLATSQVAGDGVRTFASYAVVDDAILLRSETHLYRIENK